MKDDERKSRIHIHMGGLILFVVIILILFKVDIVSKISSEQFQKNINFIESQVKTFWQSYISNPIKSKIGEIFIDTSNKALEEFQNNFTKNVLKTQNTEDTIKQTP